MKFDKIRGSVWRSNINTYLSMALVGSCALWALTVIHETAYGINYFNDTIIKIVESRKGL